MSWVHREFSKEGCAEMSGIRAIETFVGGGYVGLSGLGSDKHGIGHGEFYKEGSTQMFELGSWRVL